MQRITNVRASAAGNANFQQWLSGTKLDQTLAIEDYSMSNRGLRSELVGTPEQIAEKLDRLERAGVDLVLLQFSPQYMKRWSASPRR